MEHAIEIIRMAVWPAVVLLVALLFRVPIATFFSRLFDVRAHVSRRGVDVTLSAEKTQALRELVRVEDARAPQGTSERERVDALRRAMEEILKPTRPPPVGPRIVWADDHPEWVKGEAGLIQALGARVQHVVTNADALRLLGEGSVDRVITDITRDAGTETGFDLAEQVQAHYPRVPVIIYTGYVDGARSERAARLGVSKVTAYPSVLILAVAEAVRESHTTRWC